MYYYIFDPPVGTREYERTAQIKDYLSSLGIAGEMTSPTPGKSVEDLVHLAIAKRYSTIVAVGGMALVNRVARALEPHDVVFGIIPTVEHEDIVRLTGTNDWKSAADQLKRRRWHAIQLGLINKEICFLTPATIVLPSGMGYQLKTHSFTLEGVDGTITITPLGGSEMESGLQVEIKANAAPAKRGFLSGLFGKTNPVPEDSVFTVPSLALATEQPIPVQVAGTDLTTTPIRCTTQAKSLKLIVGKASAHPATQP